MKAIFTHVINALATSPEVVHSVQEINEDRALLELPNANLELVYLPFTDDPKWFGFEIKALKTVDR